LGRTPTRMQELLRSPYFVPETKPVSDLFHTFRKRRLSVALAVDEYGGVTGLISMEDLLECIFGDIPSPSEGREGAELASLADGSIRVDGALSIAELNQELGAALDSPEVDTIGGLILHAFGELPTEGRSITLEGLVFTVAKVEGNRIASLVVRRADPTPAQTDGDEPSSMDAPRG